MVKIFFFSQQCAQASEFCLLGEGNHIQRGIKKSLNIGNCCQRIWLPVLNNLAWRISCLTIFVSEKKDCNGSFRVRWRNSKGGMGLFLVPVLTLWSSNHFDIHVWRSVIVPPDLAHSFGVICAHYRCRINDSSPDGKTTHAKPNCLAGLATNKSRGTISQLHTWQQHGRHNRFPLYISLSKVH